MVNLLGVGEDGGGEKTIFPHLGVDSLGPPHFRW